MAVQGKARLLGWNGDRVPNHARGGSSGAGASHDDEDEGGGLLRLMVCDLVLAFLWLLSFSMIMILSGGAWFRKAVMYVGAKFLFALLGIATEGGLYNPLSVLAAFLSSGSPATLLCRISAQLVGYVLGVKLIVQTIPEYRGGPQPNVNVIVGVVMEGSLAFVAMIMNILLKETEQGFFNATFISSITRLILCSIGGWINHCWLTGIWLGIRKWGSRDRQALACLLVRTLCVNTVGLEGVRSPVAMNCLRLHNS